MIKKLVLSTLTMSSLLIAQSHMSKAEEESIKNDIEKAKAQKKVVEGTIKALQAKLPPNQHIMTNVKLGYIQTDGNTQTQNFSLDAKAKKDWGLNHLELMFDAQYGESDNLEINNRYKSELLYKYKMTKSLSVTYLLGYKYDKFSSYDYQAYTGPGLTYLALKTKIQTLNIDANILYSMDELQAKYISTFTNFNKNYSSYRAKANYSIQILKDLKFEQELSYRSSFEDSKNYFVYSKSALSSKISAMLSTGLSYKLDYTNQVAAGIQKKDTTLEAFLSIDY